MPSASLEFYPLAERTDASRIGQRGVSALGWSLGWHGRSEFKHQHAIRHVHDADQTCRPLTLMSTRKARAPMSSGTPAFLTTFSGELESCGNTGFRETEITIDGHPPAWRRSFPWIYTGGIDPYLWIPIPGCRL